MPFYPKSVDELRLFLEDEVSPKEARWALEAIFVSLYGTAGEDGSVSFAVEKEWNAEVVCDVADELSTIGLYCNQPNRDAEELTQPDDS